MNVSLAKSAVIACVLTAVAGLAGGGASAQAQGMPPEARKNIHTLFSNHTNLVRTVTLTDDGYVALTESGDPQVARALQDHVSQMRARLQDGAMVRGFDPAFRELVEHYDAITHRVEKTDRGLKITVRGKTPEAIAVAKNHAQIISAFVKNGWEEHDVNHPGVVAAESPTDSPTENARCCEDQCQDCRNGGKSKKQNNRAGGRPRGHRH